MAQCARFSRHSLFYPTFANLKLAKIQQPRAASTSTPAQRSFAPHAEFLALKKCKLTRVRLAYTGIDVTLYPAGSNSITPIFYQSLANHS
jgi:hypothetical protein